FTQKEAWVCDPFLGSGTTMKVARELKRNSIGIEILNSLIPVIRKKTGFSSENLTSYLNSDQLIVEYLQNDNHTEENYNSISNSHHSLLPQALKGYSSTNNYKYHLLLLNCRNTPLTVLNENFSLRIDGLYPGRILAVLYESTNSGSFLTLNQLSDYVMNHGLHFRDKITIQHHPDKQWEVNTQFKSKIVFNHCYYEILLFQKGKFNYKSRSKQQKEDCLIDKRKFQREKWHLTLWDFRNHSREECDPIVVRRLLELFLFNNELVGTNIAHVSCPKRQFNLDFFNQL
ncbi:MAG: DNA methyltransferase, partial [Candidatus Hermodarchaeota archaeon]